MGNVDRGAWDIEARRKELEKFMTDIQSPNPPQVAGEMPERLDARAWLIDRLYYSISTNNYGRNAVIEDTLLRVVQALEDGNISLVKNADLAHSAAPTDRDQPDAGAEEPVAYGNAGILKHRQAEFQRNGMVVYPKPMGEYTTPFYTRPATQPPAGDAGAEALEALKYLTDDGDYNDEGLAAIRTIRRPSQTERCGMSGDAQINETWSVHLQRNSDKQTRIYHQNFSPDDELVEFIWSEGNYACDCNRSQFFAEARNEPDPNEPCGDGGYLVVKIVRPDGSVLDYSEVPHAR